jgi:hypothetical protein
MSPRSVFLLSLICELPAAGTYLRHGLFCMLISCAERIVDLLDWGAVRGHLIPINRFAHAGGARCRVFIAKAIKQITVPQDLVTAAVAMKLG